MKGPEIQQTLHVIDFVIFGGTGDLAMRKLIPALYRVALQTEPFVSPRIIAIASNVPTSTEYRELVRQGLKRALGSDEWEDSKVACFLQALVCLKIDLADEGCDWDKLTARLSENVDATRIYYMALPPQLYGKVSEQLNGFALIHKDCRIVLEKPIGYDRTSAREINDQVARCFDEKQIFRIDHYLGKETVQNLLALRFANILFEKVWNNTSIDHVQITVAETVGLEGRGGFYDNAGALRDMVQNHVLQLLCLLAMEPPLRMDAESIRAEKLKVLHALRLITGPDVATEAVRAQYAAGDVTGQSVKSYLDELGCEESKTETFIALRAYIDNWRWKGVPFYLRTGKRLPERYAEIIVQFDPVPHEVYEPSAGNLEPNRLVIKLQPEEGMQLQLMTKNLQKTETRLQSTSLNLNFADYGDRSTSDGYRRLLNDVIKGDPTLFAHRDEVDLAWSWVSPILDEWRRNDDSPLTYSAGSWGPPESDSLLAAMGHSWIH